MATKPETTDTTINPEFPTGKPLAQPTASTEPVRYIPPPDVACRKGVHKLPSGNTVSNA